jgi:hypothetical protein
MVIAVSMASGVALGCGSSSTSTADAGGTGSDGGGGDGSNGDDGAGGNDGGSDAGGDAGICHLGDPCTTSGADPKCGTEAKATCNDLTNDGFPGGYCSWEPCSATELCPCGTCAHLGGEANACWKACDTDSDCRAPDYGCFNIDPLYTAGTSHKVCYLKTFACTQNADCPAIKPTCSSTDGGQGTCQ